MPAQSDNLDYSLTIASAFMLISTDKLIEEIHELWAGDTLANQMDTGKRIARLVERTRGGLNNVSTFLRDRFCSKNVDACKEVSPERRL